MEENNVSEYKIKTGKIGEKVIKTYETIEKTVVGGYQKIEDAFVEAFLEKKEDAPEKEEDKEDAAK